jgi:hypothetical protein
MRGPGGFSGGKVIEALISQLDIYPTLCDLAGVAHPAWLEGKSMLPIIRGEANEINDEVFAEVTYHAAYEPKRAVRTSRWKYIRRFGDKHTPVLPNCDDGLSKSVWLEYGWKNMRLPDESLYDLIFDPNEHNNLAADPASKTVLTEMRGRLDRWMHRTSDPLLNGPVPAPHGAQVNNPDGVSPKETPDRIAQNTDGAPSWKELQRGLPSCHLLKQIDGAVHLGHVPQHVPGVYMNRAGGCRIEQEVGGDGLVGAIEQKADQLALSVKGRGTGISARCVHGGEEVDRNVPE